MIQPTSYFLGFNRADAIGSAPPKTTPSAPAPTTDRLSNFNSAALQTALSNSPEIRPEVVTRGQSLLVDLNYPSRTIIEGLAKLFAQSPDLTDNA